MARAPSPMIRASAERGCLYEAEQKKPKQKAGLVANVIKLRKNQVQKWTWLFFAKKDKIILKKGLTKRQKCAVDFISSLIKSTLVNRGKSTIDKEKKE